MLCFPNAKINLGLHIINKRNDGYHNIETVFCPIGLCDILEIVPGPDTRNCRMDFASTGLAIEGPDDKNLCVMAYRLLCLDFNLPAIQIHLHKIIPPGAGLGGGSSDAAFMLMSLNRQFKLDLGADALSNYASRLGSDCAFFTRNSPLFGYERGNKFRNLKSFPENYDIVLVNPGIHVSSAFAYKKVNPKQPVHSLEELIQLPVKQWKDRIINDFETVIAAEFPVIGDIKDRLYKAGAEYASMSGSGSTVYGLFHEKAPAVKDQFPEYFCWTGQLGNI